MFANTLTLTINAVAKVLLRTNQDNFGSFYKFADGVEKITMQIRHDSQTVGGLPVNRHNLYVERTVFATPTTTEKYWSMTITLRDRDGSDPAVLLQNWQGLAVLFATLDDTFVTGDN